MSPPNEPWIYVNGRPVGHLQTAINKLIEGFAERNYALESTRNQGWRNYFQNEVLEEAMVSDFNCSFETLLKL